MAQSGNKLAKRMANLAQRYYGTSDLCKLQSYQLDKVTGWAMAWSPDHGKQGTKKAQQALYKKRTGTTKRYLNKNDKASIRQHRHKK